jgi:hypothetical protein
MDESIVYTITNMDDSKNPEKPKNPEILENPENEDRKNDDMTSKLDLSDYCRIQ